VFSVPSVSVEQIVRWSSGHVSAEMLVNVARFVLTTNSRTLHSASLTERLLHTHTHACHISNCSFSSSLSIKLPYSHFRVARATCEPSTNTNVSFLTHMFIKTSQLRQLYSGAANHNTCLSHVLQLNSPEVLLTQCPLYYTL